jgi:hypothetical protein
MFERRELCPEINTALAETSTGLGCAGEVPRLLEIFGFKCHIKQREEESASLRTFFEQEWPNTEPPSNRA